MNVKEHIEQIDGALDALATDPEVTSDEYIVALDDLTNRITASRRNMVIRSSLSIVCRHDRTIDQGCQECLGPEDWHLERDGENVG